MSTMPDDNTVPGDAASDSVAGGSAVDTTDRPADWRTRAGTAGLVVGNALMGLEKALFPEKRKADTEQVSDMPLDNNAPKLDYGDSGLDPLGPDDEGYWPV